jgi:transposase
VTLAQIAKANLLHTKDFVRLYRDQLSDFKTWEFKESAEKYLVFAENLGTDLSLDEVEISNGELYTILTNKKQHGKKGCLVAIVAGTKPSVVSAALCQMPLKQRRKVISVTRDMAQTMTEIASTCFPCAKQIDDRFHVHRLVSDALQEIRIELRKNSIKAHNEKVAEARKRGGHYWAPRFENGDTAKELLARGKYLLYKSKGNWSESQNESVNILFREFPKLEEAYKLCMQFRGVYEHAKNPKDGKYRLARWYQSVKKRLVTLPEFETPMQSIQLNEDTIANYFIGRLTNASAESFNSKIKNFRSLQRGVSDISFFLYRLSKLYA